MEKENKVSVKTVEILEGTDDVAKGIIQSSIRSAICIDDAYAAPYSLATEGLNFDDPKELFYSFRKDGHCDLDIYQFTDNVEWEKHKYLLHNKDLLIQDWELNSKPGAGETKYDYTLTIIKDIFENNIVPFIVIYTNREDLSDVSKVLLNNFNAHNSEDFEIMIEEFKAKFSRMSTNCEEIYNYFEDDTQINRFHEYILFPSRRNDIRKEILDSFYSFLEIETKHLEKFPKKIISGMKYFNNVESIEDAVLLLSNICLSKDRRSKLIFKNERINIERLCYSINGTVVLILHKEDRTGGVKPDKLFDVFSQSITNNPHSIINLISIELKDKFREDFSKIGTKFNTIEKNAFLHHGKNYYKKDAEDGVEVFQKTSFKNFVVRSWIHELLQKNLDLNLDSFKLIEKELSIYIPKEGSELEISLAKYASMVSCVHLANKTNKKLGFGDVFKSGNEYFLCITPHCDCFTPSKINNEFSFIKKTDSITKLAVALKNAEQGFYTFISNGKKTEAIEWACKPFTSHIPNKMNESNDKSISYSGITYDLEFVCSLKENYAQRISNNSFGQGYRVGIDLPHLS
ncbi:hypothetical protein ADIWIN_2156 [Winogradskyella psychrotolerans RS-3]|uniref:Response receiver domain-containing protein n=1 Tax=Winogradskyella psychrotolerans RS-3 TaxID=641526 RepID=S7X9X4_9FLAO|nr:hypothetical protein ADIWIN_2156 [Winogradskyella psychrotolerans RS-3]